MINFKDLKISELTSDQKDALILELLAIIEKLTALNLSLTARVEELERRLGLNSSNSSQPPSRDGFRNPPRRTRSQREVSGKTSGGQPGHEGSNLARREIVDESVRHDPGEGQCPGCGLSLATAPVVAEEKRQVHDIPLPTRPHVVEHQSFTRQCPRCGVRTAGVFPGHAGGAVCYGPRTHALVAYLQIGHALPYARTVQVLADVCGLRMSQGSVRNLTARAYKKLAGFEQENTAAIHASEVQHADETGVRVAGKTIWLHTHGTEDRTHYRVEQKRGAIASIERGCLVHDHLQSYYRQHDGRPGVRHALCNAHHLRELTAVGEVDQERWALKMRRLLRHGCHVKRVWQRTGAAPPCETLARFERIYDALLVAALAYHEGLEPLPRGLRGRRKRRPGHNLALRLEGDKADVLRFLHEASVPFTNNLAERDLRMIKTKQKVSGSFRSDQGANVFARVRSFFSTMAKQSRPVFENLLGLFAPSAV